MLEMERQARLEASGDEDDPEKREAHRLIAKWLKVFLTQTIPDLLTAEAALREVTDPSAPTEYPDGGSEWVQASSGEFPPEDDSDLAPIGP
jgi:hypothetical protein